ncbi:MAG: hypothetical protein AAFW70_10730 [Cyanobacteria bacterium J06635_10]
MKTTISVNINLNENTYFHLYSHEAPNIGIMDKTSNIIRISCSIDNLQKIDDLISTLSSLKQEITRNTIAKITSQQDNKVALEDSVYCEF